MKINLQYPYFETQVIEGLLTRDKRSHACWYYAMLATKNHDRVGKGPESQIIVVDAAYDDTRWLNKEYVQIAQSVAVLYGLSSPEDFMYFKPLVIQEARRLDMILPEEIWYPPRLLSLNS